MAPREDDEESLSSWFSQSMKAIPPGLLENWGTINRTHPGPEAAGGPRSGDTRVRTSGSQRNDIVDALSLPSLFGYIFVISAVRHDAWTERKNQSLAHKKGERRNSDFQTEERTWVSVLV